MKRVIDLLIILLVGVVGYSCSSDNTQSTHYSLKLEVGDRGATTIVVSAKSTGSGVVDARGFCWSSDNSSPTLKDSKLTVAEGKEFTAKLENLTPNTRYYIRAYISSGSEVFFSSTVEATTQKEDELFLTTPKVEQITISGAKISSELSNLVEGVTLEEEGAIYSTTNRTPYHDDGESMVKLGAISNGKVLEVELDDLNSNTLHYVRSFVKLKSGEYIYSDVSSFTTQRTKEDELLEDYVAPSYTDDYSPLAGWGQRHLWNLANVHDPSVEKCGEYYYMYTTDASYGNAHDGHGHFLYRRSKDLVNWEFMGTAMAKTPAWIKDSLNNMRQRVGLEPIDNPLYGHWAPSVKKMGGKYRLYYSVIVDNYIKTGKPNRPEDFDNSWSERAFIGLMETDDLASNNWEDRGMVVCSSTDRGLDWSRPNINNWDGYFYFNAIDPSAIVTPSGEHWLVYGSWHSGIAVVELDPASGLVLNPLGEPWEKDNLSNYGKRIYTRNRMSRWQGSEAPEVIYNPETNYYYMFIAYDELSVAYNTRVCRSRNIDGPYSGYNSNRDLGGAGGDCYPLITHPYKFKNHSGWVGISHCGVFDDGAGNWFYTSQGRLPANTGGNAYSNAIMMGHVRKIRWTSDGWPVVMPQRYGAVPDVAIEESDLIGTWENINLKYAYQKQSESEIITLTADNKVEIGGELKEWSYNKESKLLTIGSIELCVEREVDWEAKPRKATIVYAGLDSDGSSWWGKKVMLD